MSNLNPRQFGEFIGPQMGWRHPYTGTPQGGSYPHDKYGLHPYYAEKGVMNSRPINLGDMKKEMLSEN